MNRVNCANDVIANRCYQVNRVNHANDVITHRCAHASFSLRFTACDEFFLSPQSIKRGFFRRRKARKFFTQFIDDLVSQFVHALGDRALVELDGRHALAVIRANRFRVEAGSMFP